MNYFYGNEAELFAFYRIPKVLITDNRYGNMKCEAKLLYGLLLDRMTLSMKNGWLDAQNRAFIYYTIESIMEDLSCGHGKAGLLLAELERYGLLERKRQGLGKPDRLYVLKFMFGSIDFRKPTVQTAENRISANPNTGC
ncbi:replication initiator protein A [Oscillibacter ruminantium]|uniref:replication initiator protein A n=1 Tax=Oscillibacter ruminantium TaxID=1263547 RepID=UPI00331D4FFF